MDYNELAREYDLKHKSCSRCAFFTQYDAWACCHLYDKEIWRKGRAKFCKGFYYKVRNVDKYLNMQV